MWKQIQNFENMYEVSDDGRVRSVDRVAGNRHIKGRVLRPHDSGKGYSAVSLCKDSKPRTVYVHTLVANAFIPKPPSDKRLVVNHKDGNKHNNSVHNLEWVSYSQNNQHAYDEGLRLRGSQFYNAKLTEAQVLEIRRNGKYDTYENIGRRYGVDKGIIHSVLNNKSWRHVR